MSARLYLDDAALLLLAMSDPLQDRLRAVLGEHVRDGGEIWTSAAALESMQRAFLKQADASALREFWNVLNGLFREIVPLRGEDLARSVDLLEMHGLDAVTALHAALCLNHRLERVVDLWGRYDPVPELDGLDLRLASAEGGPAGVG